MIAGRAPSRPRLSGLVENPGPAHTHRSLYHQASERPLGHLSCTCPPQPSRPFFPCRPLAPVDLSPHFRTLSFPRWHTSFASGRSQNGTWRTRTSLSLRRDAHRAGVPRAHTISPAPCSTTPQPPSCAATGPTSTRTPPPSSPRPPSRNAGCAWERSWPPACSRNPRISLRTRGQPQGHGRGSRPRLRAFRRRPRAQRRGSNCARRHHLRSTRRTPPSSPTRPRRRRRSRRRTRSQRRRKRRRRLSRVLRRHRAAPRRTRSLRRRRHRHPGRILASRHFPAGGPEKSRRGSPGRLAFDGPARTPPSARSWTRNPTRARRAPSPTTSSWHRGRTTPASLHPSRSWARSTRWPPTPRPARELSGTIRRHLPWRIPARLPLWDRTDQRHWLRPRRHHLVTSPRSPTRQSAPTASPHTSRPPRNGRSSWTRTRTPCGATTWSSSSSPETRQESRAWPRRSTTASTPGTSSRVTTCPRWTRSRPSRLPPRCPPSRLGCARPCDTWPKSSTCPRPRWPGGRKRCSASRGTVGDTPTCTGRTGGPRTSSWSPPSTGTNAPLPTSPPPRASTPSASAPRSTCPTTSACTPRRPAGHPTSATRASRSTDKAGTWRAWPWRTCWPTRRPPTPGPRTCSPWSGRPRTTRCPFPQKRSSKPCRPSATAACTATRRTTPTSWTRGCAARGSACPCCGRVSSGGASRHGRRHHLHRLSLLSPPCRAPLHRRLPRALRQRLHKRPRRKRQYPLYRQPVLGALSCILLYRKISRTPPWRPRWKQEIRRARMRNSDNPFPHPYRSSAPRYVGSPAWGPRWRQGPRRPWRWISDGPPRRITQAARQPPPKSPQGRTVRCATPPCQPRRPQKRSPPPSDGEHGPATAGASGSHRATASHLGADRAPGEGARDDFGHPRACRAPAPGRRPRAASDRAPRPTQWSRGRYGSGPPGPGIPGLIT